MLERERKKGSWLWADEEVSHSQLIGSKTNRNKSNAQSTILVESNGTDIELLVLSRRVHYKIESVLENASNAFDYRLAKIVAGI